MRLSTEFEGIDPNKVDERIDALKQAIESQLTPIIQELQQTRALEKATISWYEGNTADTVHNAAQNGETVTRQSLEQKTPAASVDTNDGSEFTSRIEKLMQKRPGFSLSAFFKGEVRNRKVTFLEDLKEKGELLLQDANKALEHSQTSLEQTREDQWNRFENAQKFYDDLTQAITAQDTDTLLSVIQSDAAKAIPAHQYKDLLLKPMNDHDTAMLAIADIGFTDPKKEAEVIAAVLNSLNNDFEALQLIQSSIPKIANKDKCERYQAYTNAFAGMFIPVSENYVINVNGFRGAEYNDGKLQLNRTRRYSDDITMPEEQARNIMAALAERPNFMWAGENDVINVNGFRGAEYRDGKLQLNRMGRYSDDITMPEEQARNIMAALAERPNFMWAGENDVINVNGFRGAEYSDGKLQLNRMGRYSDDITMPEEQARDIMAALAERPNFMWAGENDVINVNGFRGAEYNDGKLQLNRMGRYSDDITMPEEQARDIMAALAERPNFMWAGENGVINVNGFRGAEYSYGQLQLNRMGQYSDDITMSEEEAHTFRKSYRQLGQRMAVLGAYGANHDQLRYGLQEARAWENDYRNTHQDDSDSLIDYLPLIIVAAIILFDGNEPQLDMNDTDTLDAPDAADGTDMDHDFADASGLNDMDTDMDSDLGIDSFEADFDDMATDMDMDMDTDMDCDVGGFDAGGDIGGGCDFGGFDM